MGFEGLCSLSEVLKVNKTLTTLDLLCVKQNGKAKQRHVNKKTSTKQATTSALKNRVH